MVHSFRLLRQWKSHHGDTLLCPRNGRFFSSSTYKESLKYRSATSPPSLIYYLQELCGMSLENATLISKKLHLTTTNNAESVLNMLQDQGFTKAQIEKVISARPKILLSDPNKLVKPSFKFLVSLGLIDSNVVSKVIKSHSALESGGESVVQFFDRHGFTSEEISRLILKCPRILLFNVKTLQPKLEFLGSLKMSDVEIRRFLLKEPYVLTRSLENHIKPSVMTLRRVVGNDLNVVRVITKCSWTLRIRLENILEPNVSLLQNLEISMVYIMNIFLRDPKMLFVSVDRLNNAVSYAKTLELDPSKFAFAHVLYCKCIVSDAQWDQKLEAYKSFGLKDEEVRSAVRRSPRCMLVSEKKIHEMMDFFVKELKMKPSCVMTYPYLMQISLKMRCLPRCAIMQLLVSKKVVKSFNLGVIMTYTEKIFAKLIVNKYVPIVPKIKMASQGKINFKGFSGGYWDETTYHVLE